MLMPGVAQPAIQEGKYVADVIRRRVEGRQQPEPFWYWDKGDLAIVGRTYAVADLRFIRFAGFAGWVIWAVVHIYFLIGFANRLFVLLQWGLDFLTKRRRVRVLSQEPPSAQNLDRKSTRLNSSHTVISYAVFCLKKKKRNIYSKDVLH